METSLHAIPTSPAISLGSKINDPPTHRTTTASNKAAAVATPVREDRGPRHAVGVEPEARGRRREVVFRSPAAPAGQQDVDA
ncbi:hypothetical protein DL770_001333 [Monosporascus sp. CRB-9-2]|nr:hypothetical protein DL770_001333 [Monosporascus sp. CRB-9-2]